MSSNSPTTRATTKAWKKQRQRRPTSTTDPSAKARKTQRSNRQQVQQGQQSQQSQQEPRQPNQQQLQEESKNNNSNSNNNNNNTRHHGNNNNKNNSNSGARNIASNNNNSDNEKKTREKKNSNNNSNNNSSNSNKNSRTQDVTVRTNNKNNNNNNKNNRNIAENRNRGHDNRYDDGHYGGYEDWHDGIGLNDFAERDGMRRFENVGQVRCDGHCRMSFNRGYNSGNWNRCRRDNRFSQGYGFQSSRGNQNPQERRNSGKNNRGDDGKQHGKSKRDNRNNSDGQGDKYNDNTSGDAKNSNYDAGNSGYGGNNGGDNGGNSNGRDSGYGGGNDGNSNHDAFVTYNYAPPVWDTPGADYVETHIYCKYTNTITKIYPPLLIHTFFSIQLNRSNVIIIDPKSWQNINRLSNYQGRKNGWEISNVGTFFDYVYFRPKNTRELIESIYGKNCQTIDPKSVYNIESNCFRISVINGNLRIIINHGVKYLIFRFLIPYLNTSRNEFEPLFCVCVENRANERQYWQCMNIFTTEKLIEFFQAAIGKTVVDINGIYNGNSNNNINNSDISSDIIKQFFLPPPNECVYKVIYGNLEFKHGKGLYKLICAIENCLKDKNNIQYYKLNKHLLEELENILNGNQGMSIEDLIGLIYNGIGKSVSMAIKYGIAATQKYIDKRGRIYFELVLLLEIETHAGIYQFGLALIENKIGNNNFNNNNNNFAIDENGYQICGYDIAAILTSKMIKDNVSQNNAILCHAGLEYDSVKYDSIPCLGFDEYMKTKDPNGDIRHYWPFDMRRGPRKTSFFHKVEQQQQQRQVQTLNSANAQTAQINNNNNNNNNNNHNTIVVGKNVKHNRNVSVRTNIANTKNNSPTKPIIPKSASKEFENKAFRTMGQLCEKEYAKSNQNNNNNGINDLLLTKKSGLNKSHKAPNA